LLHALNTTIGRVYLALAAVALVFVLGSPAFAQANDLQSAATSAATSAVGIVVAVSVITVAVALGLWALGKVRGR
jgi:hypothetical protein